MDYIERTFMLKDIPNFPGYKIDELGNVFNPKGKQILRKDSWQGYPRVRIKHEDGSWKNRKIHRLVVLSHLGEDVSNKEVRHSDNNRANFSLHNLEWTDRTGNAADRLARGSYHLKTQLVGGKSLLILGDNKYLDPEAKKVYHVTSDPLGEDGVTPVTSLDKIAHLKYALIDLDSGRIQSGLNTYVNSDSFRKKHIEKKAGRLHNLYKRVKELKKSKPSYPEAHKRLFNAFTPAELTSDKKFRDRMIAYSPGFLKREFVIPKKVRDFADKGSETAKGILRDYHFQSGGFIKKAEWTSKKNADKHALKHAKSMGLSEEDYKNKAIAALKEKKALINTRGDVSKSRVGKNILVHKDGKVITYYSKVAYVRKVQRHLENAVDNFKDWGYHQDAVQTHLDIKEKKKKK